MYYIQVIPWPHTWVTQAHAWVPIFPRMGHNPHMGTGNPTHGTWTTHGTRESHTWVFFPPMGPGKALSDPRELAFQISKEYERFSKYRNTVKVAVFFGGMPIKKDEEVLKKNCSHIVVGTPGRILALARSKALNMKNIKHFILDECDKMLEALGKFLRCHFHCVGLTKDDIILLRSPQATVVARQKCGTLGL